MFDKQFLDFTVTCSSLMPADASSASKTSHSVTSVSSTIIHGTARFLALFEEEKQKLEFLHKQQLLDLESRFQNFRTRATNEYVKLIERVQGLEAELAITKEELLKARETANETRIPSVNGETVNGETRDQGETVYPIHSGQPVHHLDQNQITQAPDSGIVEDIPDSSKPTLPQYPENHKKTLKDWEAKYHAVEVQRALLQQSLATATVFNRHYTSKNISIDQPQLRRVANSPEGPLNG